MLAEEMLAGAVSEPHADYVGEVGARPGVGPAVRDLERAAGRDFVCEQLGKAPHEGRA
jgi:hypothetical protein